MEQENLNLDFNRQQLIVKALNKIPVHTAAADALGVSVRNLYLLKRRYNIQFNKMTNRYYCQQTSKTNHASSKKYHGYVN